MCFTPWISLSTAIIELALATILLLFFKKTTFRNFFAGFIYLLGFYQFTEYMVCSAENPFLWAKIGFITYSLFPAIALHATLKFLKKKPSKILIYFIPIVATITAFVIPGFIIKAECNGFFVSVQTIFNTSTYLFDSILFWIYVGYYFGFIFLAIILAYINYRKQKNKLKKEIEIIEIFGILLMTIPVILLIIIFPFSGQMFPSILCQFALFVAIAAFIGVYLESKIKKKRKRK